jgi:hypothetical protein
MQRINNRINTITTTRSKNSSSSSSNNGHKVFVHVLLHILIFITFIETSFVSSFTTIPVTLSQVPMTTFHSSSIPNNNRNKYRWTHDEGNDKRTFINANTSPSTMLSSTKGEDNEMNNNGINQEGVSFKATLSLLTKELWFLPFISFLTGISPAVQIVGESHISRMPDNVIAHDIDTLLLWPAVIRGGGIDSGGGAGTGSGGSVPTIFQAPFAAVTNESMYDVDWSAVWSTYSSHVALSLLISFMLSFSLLLFLETDDV